VSDPHLADDVDVVIAGGGPAGCAVALALAAHFDGSVVVLEKERYPRDKLCGGAVSAAGIETLSRLGVQPSVPFFPIREARLRYGDKEIRFQGEPALSVFNRRELDAELARAVQRRGVLLREGATVSDAFRRSDRIEVRSNLGTHRARVLVIADGSGGRLRRKLGFSTVPVARLLEVKTRGCDDSQCHAEGFAMFDFSTLDDRVQGYYWDFPMNDQEGRAVNSGVFDARIRPRRRRANLSEVLARGLRRRSVEEPKLQGFGIRWHSPRQEIAQPQVLLVGDAAGVDPLFGEGIPFALRYGELAAEEIVRAFDAGDFSFSSYRSSVRHSDVGRSLHRRWLLAQVLYAGWPRPLLSLCWRLARWHMERRAS
jgi:geranylgeranyl reductase family protein